MQKSSYMKDVIKRFCTHRLAMAGLCVLLVELVLLFLLPLLMKLEPYEIYSGFGSAPSKEHILGTDSTGRDLFARLIYGGRTSLFVGFFSVLISFATLLLQLLLRLLLVLQMLFCRNRDLAF